MKNKLPLDDIKFIQNILRKGSTRWKGRSECLKLARKRVFARIGNRGQRIYKYHWQCAICKRWDKNVNSMEVDHIEEIGPFKGDWNDYLLRHFPPQEKLQCLCITCHMKKTSLYNSAKSKWSRKK